METITLPQPSFVLCRGCGLPIDVWEPPGFRIERDSVRGRFDLTRVDPSEALCPECRIQQTPEARRTDVANVYASHRIVRAEIEAPARGTLFVMNTQGAAAVKWAKDFRLTMYWLKLPEWNAAYPQPRMCLTPDDPKEPPLNFIWFGPMSSTT